MNPFRNELTAAHAKIAQLEERIQHLQHGRPMPQKKQLPRSMIVYFLFSVLIFVVLGAVTIVTFVAFMRSGSGHHHKDVTTADHPERNEAYDGVPPLLNRGPIAPSTSASVPTNP